VTFVPLRRPRSHDAVTAASIIADLEQRLSARAGGEEGGVVAAFVAVQGRLIHDDADEQRFR
jgi:hypothetical protein